MSGNAKQRRVAKRRYLRWFEARYDAIAAGQKAMEARALEMVGLMFPAFKGREKKGSQG